MECKSIGIILGGLVIVTIVAAGVYIVYRKEREKLVGKIRNINSLDTDSVRNWISNQDLESYNNAYTVCVLRKDSLPKDVLRKARLFSLEDNLALVCMYDKSSNQVIQKELVYYSTVSNDFAENFVEVQFGA